MTESIRPSKKLVYLNVASVVSFALLAIITRISASSTKDSAGLNYAFGIALLPLLIPLWLVWFFTILGDFIFIVRAIAKKQKIQLPSISKPIKLLVIVLLLFLFFIWPWVTSTLP